MDPSEFLQGRTRETSIYRDAEGRWFQDGEPLEHENLVRSFEGWIERAEDGRYCLKNDINWAYFTLEGAPYFVRRARVEADGVVMELSGGLSEVLDATTLRQGPDGALYCSVRGDLAARFDRHVLTQLEDHVGEDDEGPFLSLNGRKVRPRVVADPLSHPSGRVAEGVR